MESLEMIALDSPRWRDLSHAYGSAHDVPEVIVAIATESRPGAEAWQAKQAWDYLWHALYQDGMVYSAALAAIPHLVEIAEARALGERVEFLSYVAAVVSADRQAFDGDLEAAFSAAVQRARGWSLAAVLATRASDPQAIAKAVNSFVALRHRVSACNDSVWNLSFGDLDADCPRCNGEWVVVISADAAQAQSPDRIGEPCDRRRPPYLEFLDGSPMTLANAARQEEVVRSGSKLLAKSTDPEFEVAEIPMVCAALARSMGDHAMARKIANLELIVRCPVCQQESPILAAIQKHLECQ